VAFSLHKTGYWLECWFDPNEKVDRCKLTNEDGSVAFEDVFVPCVGQAPLPQSELVFKRDTGQTWIQPPDKRVNVPVVYVRYGQMLVSKSLYPLAEQQIGCSGG
jgi:hypothetical protein